MAGKPEGTFISFREKDRIRLGGCRQQGRVLNTSYCSAMQQSRCHGTEVAFGVETITLSTPEPAVWNFLVTKP